MKFFRRHRYLVGVMGVAALCLAGVFCGTIEENMLALVPQRIKRQVQLFEHSPLSQKLIVIVSSATDEQTRQISQQLQQRLVEHQLIDPPRPVTDNMVQYMLRALPARFSPQVQQMTEQKLTEKSVARQLADFYEQLFSFQSFLVAQLLKQDPFYLSGIMFDKWAQIGRRASGNYEEGFLSARGGTLQAGLYDAKSSVSDWAGAGRLQRFFTEYQATLPDGVRAFFMGGLRYTLENAALIKRDLGWLTLAGLTCLSGIFLWFFRTKRALLIYALAVLVLPPAAWVTQLLFGHISAITLGFGSVVVGLSVDYAIYVYFALQQTSPRVTDTLRRIRPHLLCNFLTSALCFVALLCSSVEVFKQLAVFALVALSLAWWISLYVFPPYFVGQAVQSAPVYTRPVRPLSFRNACLISVLLLLFGVWGISHITYSQGLDSLNSTSAGFKQDKQLADELFSADKNALLFALGRTKEQALSNNEQLAAKLPSALPISELFVSSRTQIENEARWREFWNVSRRQDLRLLLAREARKKGFKADSFDSFWKWLGQTDQESDVDFSMLYNPVLQLSTELYAVVNVVPNEPVYEQAADGQTAVFVSAPHLQRELVAGVKQEAVRVFCLALLFNLIAVWAVFKNFKETLLCFVPVILGGCVLFGCLAAGKIQVNLFGLIFLPLLVGLGIDYAIFQLMKYRLQSHTATTVYPTQALLAAGLSTLAGFGVLVLAKHAVLFMMGLCALLGIGGAIGAAVWILPAFRERIV